MPYALILWFVFTSTAVEATLIVNGSFELHGDTGPGPIPVGSDFLTGWIVTRDNVDYIGGCSNGARCLDLDGSSFGGVAQSFSTQPGIEYLVNFDMSGNPSFFDPAEPALKLMRVSAAGFSADFSFLVTGPREGSPTGWVTNEWVFTATSEISVLEFYSLDSIEAGYSGSFGPALDNVAVSAVPEPSTALLLLASLVDPPDQRVLEVDGHAVERLVVAEHREDDVGLRQRQILVRRHEPLVARAVVDLVAGVAVIADDQLQVRQFRGQVRFHPAVVLHAVGQAVADQHDVIALLEAHGRCRRQLRDGDGAEAEDDDSQ